MSDRKTNQLIKITIVLKASVFVENNCQSRPFAVSVPVSRESIISSVSVLPFQRDSLPIVIIASFFLPLLKSHLGDSGIILKEIENCLCFRSRGLAMVCDCGTPWTFLLDFIHLMLII